MLHTRFNCLHFTSPGNTNGDTQSHSSGTDYTTSPLSSYTLSTTYACLEIPPHHLHKVRKRLLISSYADSYVFVNTFILGRFQIAISGFLAKSMAFQHSVLNLYGCSKTQ